MRRHTRFRRSRPCSKSQRGQKTGQRGLAGASNDAGSRAFWQPEVEKEIFAKCRGGGDNQLQAKPQHQFSVVHFQHQMPTRAPSAASSDAVKKPSLRQSAVSKTARRKPNPGPPCPTSLHVGSPRSQLPHGGEDQTCPGNPCQAQAMRLSLRMVATDSVGGSCNKPIPKHVSQFSPQQIRLMVGH